MSESDGNADINIIGKVLFTWQGAEAVAVLHRDGSWTSPDPTITDCLNASFGVERWSPADGQKGYQQLHEAAAWLKGRVVAPEVGDDPPGLAY